MYDADDYQHTFAQILHPTLTAIYPWLSGLLTVVVVIAAILLIRAMILRRREEDRLEPMVSMAIAFAAIFVMMVITLAFDPYASAHARLGAWCLLSMIPLGFLAFKEIRGDWTFREDWNFGPFCILFFVPPGIIAVLIGIFFVHTAMTIPAYARMIPHHIELIASQVVAGLAHMSPAQTAALTAALLLLGLFNQSIKLLKTIWRVFAKQL